MMSELPENKMSDDKKKEVHIEAIKRFGETYAADEDQRELAAEDLRFAQVEGAQWDEWSRTIREGSPIYEINHIAAAVAQVTGAYKESSISTVVRGSNSAATKDVADTYMGLIRHIESKSNAKDAYDIAQFLLVNTGFGAWQVDHQFEDEGFDQELIIKPINSPLTSVWWDNNARSPNKEDAQWAFIARGYTEESYKSLWPDDPVVSFGNTNLLNSAFNTNWFKNNLIQVAEYYVREPVKRTLLRMSDGRDVWLDKVTDVLDEMAANGVAQIKTRVVETTKVVKYVMNGSKILIGPHPTPFKTIPLIAVYGENHYEEDNHFFRGMVRMGKDSQRVLNWITSLMVETNAKTPQDPIWVTDKQIEGREDEYGRMAVDNEPFMVYTPDERAPGPPQRTGSPAFNQSGAAIAQNAATDIQITTQRPLADIPANVGQEILLATKKAVDSGVQVFQSAMARGIQATAQIIVDAAPTMYDQQRQIRILNADGTTKFVAINETITDRQTGKDVIVNDLSQGSYDVVSSSGPAFETSRTAAANAMAALIQLDPSLIETGKDLMVGAIDSPVFADLHKRVRKDMINRGIVEPTEEEQAEMQPTEEEQAEMQRKIEFEQRQIELGLRRQEAEISLLESTAKVEAARATKADAEAIAALAKNELLISEEEGAQAKTIHERVKTQETMTNIVKTKIESGLPITKSNIEGLEANQDLINHDIEEEIIKKVEGQEQQILNNEENNV